MRLVRSSPRPVAEMALFHLKLGVLVSIPHRFGATPRLDSSKTSNSVGQGVVIKAKDKKRGDDL